jgi:hypothetical protein
MPWVLMLSITAAPSCGDDGGATQFSDEYGPAVEGEEAVEGAAIEAGLMALGIAAAEPDATIDDIVAAGSLSFGSALQDPQCVTTTVAGAVATHVMRDCTGPYGLLEVSGALTAHYRFSADGLTVALESTGLEANGGTLSLSASGVSSAVDDQQRLAVTTSSAFIGPKGSEISRFGAYTASWDATKGCLGLTGTWSSTTSEGIRWSTAVAAYERCEGRCPEPGGTVTLTGGGGGGGSEVTLSYDGSDQLRWVTGRGRIGTVTLSCAPG